MFSKFAALFALLALASASVIPEVKIDSVPVSKTTIHGPSGEITKEESFPVITHQAPVLRLHDFPQLVAPHSVVPLIHPEVPVVVRPEVPLVHHEIPFLVKPEVPLVVPEQRLLTVAPHGLPLVAPLTGFPHYYRNAVKYWA